jgi:hypothetical protein
MFSETLNQSLGFLFSPDYFDLTTLAASLTDELTIYYTSDLIINYVWSFLYLMLQ